MTRRYGSVFFSSEGEAADLLIKFIDEAELSLDVAVYAITHDDLVEALIRAHARGVAVRVLMDKAMAGQAASDDEKLASAGVLIRLDQVDGSMHHKFVIRDGRGDDKYAVATGSFNWTARADERNAENITLIRLRYMVKEFQDEFDRMWAENDPAAL